MGVPEPVAAAVAGFWQQCLLDLPALAGHEQPDAWAFGDSAEMADELLALVLAGTKCATAGLAAEYQAEGEPLPEPGDLSIVVNGRGAPACLIRTTDVRVGSLESVDDQFAFDEGEGDRTRSWWLREHRVFFHRAAKLAGLELEPDIPTVFERFELIWPEAPSG